MTQGEHILVCLSSSPANGTIIRAAARMAEAFKGEFTALYVETSQSQKMDEEPASGAYPSGKEAGSQDRNHLRGRHCVSDI